MTDTAPSRGCPDPSGHRAFYETFRLCFVPGLSLSFATPASPSSVLVAVSRLSLRLRCSFGSRLPRLAQTSDNPRLALSEPQCSESRTRGLLSFGRYSLCDMARTKQTARGSTGGKVSRREIETRAARRAAGVWRENGKEVRERSSHRVNSDYIDLDDRRNAEHETSLWEHTGRSDVAAPNPPTARELPCAEVLQVEYIDSPRSRNEINLTHHHLVHAK